MKKLLFVFLFGALCVMGNAQPLVKVYRLGNVTVGLPYHGCVSTLCYNDSIYRFVIIGNGNSDTWGFDLADTPQKSKAILQGIVDSYQGADTIWIDGYTIECEKDKGFYVAEAAPGRTLPEGTDFWFSIDNIKRDIKYLNRVEKGKLRWRDRRALRKFNRKIKV
jgi:hypothetical protein